MPAATKTKPNYQLLAILLLVWFGLPNLFGLILFPVLITTGQIKYIGILTNPQLPLAYALAFEYTEHSLLHLPNPIAGFSNPPVHGFSNGNFFAFNPHKLDDHSDLILHELRHAQQATVLGPFFYFLYSASNDLGTLRGYSYWETYLTNPFERDAFSITKDQTRYNQIIDERIPHQTDLKLLP